MNNNAILFGFKSCGKTYFGKQLAHAVQRPFLDTDALIEAQAGLTCREIVTQLGELEFRKMEYRLLLSLQHVENSVIALGGGTLCYPESLSVAERLGKLIYLKTTPELIHQRLFSQGADPFLHNFEKIYRERERIYETISAYGLDMQKKTDAEIIEELKMAIYGQ
jgi:shikimate kinase